MSLPWVLCGVVTTLLVMVFLSLCRYASELGKMRLRYMGEKARNDDLVLTAKRQGKQIWAQREVIADQAETIHRLEAAIKVG